MILYCILFLFLQILIVCSQSVPTSGPTVAQLSPTYSCINASELAYNSFNEISIIASLINCLTNIQDGMLYPGYSSGKLLNVSVQVEVIT